MIEETQDSTMKTVVVQGPGEPLVKSDAHVPAPGRNQLAAHALGFATCYIGLVKVFRRDMEFKGKVLKMDDRFEIAMGFSLGYPKGQIDTAVKRESLRVDWID